MVRLIDPGNTLMQALCLLSEMIYPPHPVAEKIHKKMAEGGYASEEDFFIEMESFIYDSDLHLQRYYFPVSGEVVDKRGLVRQAPDPLLVKYELLISEAIHGVQRQISGSETKLFEDVDGVYQKLMAASWSVESVSGFLVGQVILFLTEPLTEDEVKSAARKIETLKPLEMPDRGSRPVYYAGKQDLERSILSQFPMIHMPMGATMPSRVQQASKPMPTTININTEDE